MQPTKSSVVMATGCHGDIAIATTTGFHDDGGGGEREGGGGGSEEDGVCLWCVGERAGSGPGDDHRREVSGRGLEVSGLVWGDGPGRLDN